MAPETRKEGRNAEDYCRRSYGLLKGKVRHKQRMPGRCPAFSSRKTLNPNHSARRMPRAGKRYGEDENFT